MRRCVALAAAAATVALSCASLGASAYDSENVLCFYEERGSILCPGAAGCCEHFCCGIPRPGRHPDFGPGPGLGPGPSGFHIMPILVGIVFFVGVSCFIGICVSGVIKACRHRNSAPPFEAYPAAPYPPQVWSPMPMPTPMPAPVPMPAHPGGSAAWQARVDDPPPPYHTVVAGAPPPC